MLVNEEQLENAPCPIVVTLLGIVYDVIPGRTATNSPFLTNALLSPVANLP